jgi:phosphate transport system permease protein
MQHGAEPGTLPRPLASPRMTRSASPTPASRTVVPLPSRPQSRAAQPLGRRIVEELVRLALFGTSAITILTTLGIVGVLAFETVNFFRQVSLWDFLTDTQWTPLFIDKHFGILVLASATFLTSAIALAVALPVGLMAAIYLSEFASPKTRRTLKPILEVLAGVPTVVYGYFALLFVTPMLKLIFPEISGFNALSAGIVMGIMILPLVISLSEDALFAVPTGLRDAGLALGATRCEVSLKIVVPAALSGIVAAVILAISRAVGETMIVAIAAGQSPRLTLNPFVPVETMTAYIVQVSLGDTPHGTLEYQTIFAVGMSLFLMTLVLNVLGDRLVRRYRERYV